jgi:hypothetical protein
MPRESLDPPFLLSRLRPAWWAASMLALASTLALACFKRGSDPRGAESNGSGGRKPSVETLPGYLSPAGVQPLALRSAAKPPAPRETLDPKRVEPSRPENVVVSNPSVAPGAEQASQ